jgi:hypothetical protein
VSDGLDMKAWIVAASLAAGVTVQGAVCAQVAGGAGPFPPPNLILLVDSTGKVAARPLNDTIMVVTVNRSGIAAPAFIRPIYDADGHTASGLATWQSGGSVLFASSDCTTGAHVYSSTHAALRATTQVQTPGGIVLYVGAIGTTTTVAIRSILYDNGCSPVTVRQNGLIPVLATVNLSTAYPPPLSFQ